MFVDDLRSGIDAITNPDKNTKKGMALGKSLSMYYKFIVIPMILLAIATFVAYSTKPVGTIGAGIAAVAVLFSLLILYPVLLLIAAAIYHISGLVLGGFKKGYAATFTATTYSVFPPLLAAWIITLINAASVIVGVLLYLVVGLWSLWVLIVALSNQQGVSKGRAFIVWLIPTIIIGIILVLIVGALALAIIGMNSTVLPSTAPVA